MNLMQLIDKPSDIVEAIFNHYEHSGFEPSAEEQEVMLDL